MTRKIHFFTEGLKAMALRRVRTGYMYALVLTAAFACGEGQCPCEYNT